MSSVISIVEEEPTLAIAKFTAELALADSESDKTGQNVASHYNEIENLVTDEKYEELIDILLRSADAVLKKSSEKDIECVFSVITSHITSVKTADSAHALCKKISSVLTADKTDNAHLRIKLLFSLHNTVTFPEARLAVYLTAIRYSLDSGVWELVLPTVKQLGPTWKYLKDNRTHLGETCLLVSLLLEESRGPSEESLAYLVKYLNEIRSDDQTAMAEARQHAIRACQLYLKSPAIFQTVTAGEEIVYLNELSSMPAVRQLESSEPESLNLQLVEIFFRGDLEAFSGFKAANSAFIEELGVSEDALLSKVRLLSLARIANEEVSREVRYSTVQKALQVDADEVEEWAVKAISGKLLFGVLDQVREVIIVSQSVPVKFGESEWKQLRADLGSWKEKLGNVSRVIQTARANGGVPTI